MVSFDLRAMDAEECLATEDGMEALARSIERSEYAWVAEDEEGQIVAAWGVRELPLLCRGADVWLLSGHRAEANRIAFGRRSVREVAKLVKRYGSLYARVWVKHALARKWLEWLGFRTVQVDGAFLVMRKEERPKWAH